MSSDDWTEATYDDGYTLFQCIECSACDDQECCPGETIPFYVDSRENMFCHACKVEEDEWLRGGKGKG